MLRTLFVLLLAASLPLASQESRPAVPTQASDSRAPEVLTIEAVISEVHSHNPAVAASRLTTESQRRRVAPAGALPDPNFTLSWMGDPVPFKTQAGSMSTYRGIGVMQMVPLGGKRELRREMARREAGVSEIDELAVARRLTADAKAAFYEYQYATSALEITNRNKARLQQLSEISEARYRVGKAMQQDVLRSQVELSMLLQKVVMLEQQRETAIARLNTLMGRPADAPLAPPAVSRTKPELPSLDALAAAAEANEPMLKKDRAMIERNQVAVAMANKEIIPDLSVGYMYQQQPGMKDMHGMQFTVNLPIFYRSKQKEQVAEAKLALKAAEEGREARRLDVNYEVKQMYAMAKSSGNMLDLYEKAILPQAELTLQSSQSAYGVGSVDFLTVVTNLSTIYSYQIDYQRQLADYSTAVARLEAMTGELVQGQPVESSRPTAGSKEQTK